MNTIGFIGAFDKTDLILYIARILVAMNKKVLVIDSTINQKAKYVVPVINPTTSYVTNFEDIDVAVGLYSFNEVKQYLGMPEHAELTYDICLIDIDNTENLETFDMRNVATCNYFVTSFDLFSLKKGLEILSGVKEPLNLTKVLFTKSMTKEEDDYLNFLSLGYKIKWNEEQIYFPFEVGDQSIIIENQRLAKIKLKGLSTTYKDSLMYMIEKITGETNSFTLKKVIKLLEKGV